MTMPYKPRMATLDEVTIGRKNDTACIAFNDGTTGSVNLVFDSPVDLMTDAEILDRHNEIVRFQLESAASWHPVEIAEGRPQIKRDRKSRSWSTQGHVLRCVVGPASEDNEPTVQIDDHELSLHEFGKMIQSFEGWGMRIVFVSEDQLSNPPTPEVRKAPKPIPRKVLEELAAAEELRQSRQHRDA